MKKTKYDRAFKVKAVQLAKAIGSRRAAEKLKISRNTLNDWRYNQISRDELTAAGNIRKEAKNMSELDKAQVSSNIDKEPTIKTLLQSHLDIANRAYMHGDLDTTISLTTQMIGLCYLSGIGVKQNQEYALELFTDAALLGAAFEGISLTNIYCDGESSRNS